MELETFFENLEYTNACMLGKYRLTIDKELIFPDNSTPDPWGRALHGA